MVTLSVCLIVKNEESVLARCLDCFTGIADEIVIVDTGSTDRTREIAGKYTDRVYSLKWHDDFSEARNYAFSRATMDFIYSADADEVLDEENRKKLLDLKKSMPDDVDIVQLKYANQLQFNTTYNFDVEYRPKLYRRLRTFRWTGPVHETVDLGIHAVKSDIAVRHMPQKLHSPRDFGIFQRILRNGPLSPHLHRMYAKELFIAGKKSDFLDAYPYFEGTLHDETKSLDDVRISQCVVAKGARLKGDAMALMKAALKNVVGGKPSAEVCCELGAFFENRSDFEEAATWYYTAAFGAESELDIHSSGDLPLLRLSACYQALNLPREAEAYREQAHSWKIPKADG